MGRMSIVRTTRNYLSMTKCGQLVNWMETFEYEKLNLALTAMIKTSERGERHSHTEKHDTHTHEKARPETQRKRHACRQSMSVNFIGKLYLQHIRTQNGAIHSAVHDKSRFGNFASLDAFTNAAKSDYM